MAERIALNSSVADVVGFLEEKGLGDLKGKLQGIQLMVLIIL